MEDFKCQTEELKLSYNIQGDVAERAKEVTQHDLCLGKLAFLGLGGRYFCCCMV